jgi:cell division protein FtsN
MAISPSDNKEVQGDVSGIKRKLAWRMGIAGLTIVGLLGGLALFDLFNDTQNEPVPGVAQFTEPVPVQKKMPTQPLTSAEPGSETPKDEKKAAEPESTAAPLDKSAPPLEPPPRPEVAAQPVLPRASQPAPHAQARSGESRPAPMTAAPSRAEPPVAMGQTPPAPPRLFTGYALQAGVFADPRRAEELHARLTLEGIPSTIEARVQVGPFKSREEAEASRVKLKALGIDAVMLIPKGVKH